MMEEQKDAILLLTEWLDTTPETTGKSMSDIHTRRTRKALQVALLALRNPYRPPEWHTMSSAPKSPASDHLIYLLCFVPDFASKLDVDAGVCICWWDPDLLKWVTESSTGGVKPTFWSSRVCAPDQVRPKPKSKYKSAEASASVEMVL
jgi:hypothetical protein